MSASNLAWGTVPVVAAAAAGTAATGGKGTGVNSAWYRSLTKPDIQPPKQAFPIVWTSLYADVAVAATVTQSRLTAKRRRRFRAALAVNMALNAGWCFTFFRARRLDLAVLSAGALALSSADLTRRAAKAGVGPTLGMGAYAAWCGFATMLSAAVRRANPRA